MDRLLDQIIFESIIKNIHKYTEHFILIITGIKLLSFLDKNKHNGSHTLRLERSILKPDIRNMSDVAPDLKYSQSMSLN